MPKGKPLGPLSNTGLFGKVLTNDSFGVADQRSREKVIAGYERRRDLMVISMRENEKREVVSDGHFEMCFRE